MINIFKEYQGKNITIEGYRTEFYVPNVEEKEEFIMEAQEGLCFEREGFEIVAVEGHIEEGELIQ